MGLRKQDLCKQALCIVFDSRKPAYTAQKQLAGLVAVAEMLELQDWSRYCLRHLLHSMIACHPIQRDKQSPQEPAQTDRQADRQTDRQTGRQTDSQPSGLNKPASVREVNRQPAERSWGNAECLAVTQS